MTRQEAIEKLKRERNDVCHGCAHPSMVGWCENHCKLPEAYDMAIETLGQSEAPCYLGSPCEYQNPNAEIQEERTKKRTETHACVCISQQDAVELAMKYCPDDDGAVQCDGDIRGLLDELENLPPVQQEQNWILCGETVDIPDHEVLACDRCGEFIIGYLDCKDEQWICESDSNLMYDPVAWCELPKPYKEGGADVR